MKVVSWETFRKRQRNPPHGYLAEKCAAAMARRGMCLLCVVPNSDRLLAESPKDMVYRIANRLRPLTSEVVYRRFVCADVTYYEIYAK